jgi:2-iminobutanoate/2-iminopropanoate deaminase
MIDGDIAAQAQRVLENLGALLEAAGLSLAHVVRTTVFLADMNDFQAMNEVYATFFREPYPARSTVQAARLPRDARIEIDAIASYEDQADRAGGA